MVAEPFTDLANGSEIGPFVSWLQETADQHGYTHDKDLARAVELIRDSVYLQRVKFFTQHLMRLQMDEHTVLAGILFYAVYLNEISLKAVPWDDVRNLLSSLQKLTRVSDVALESSEFQRNRHETQTDNVRQMLIAMIDDPRVIVLKLVERAVALQSLNPSSESAFHIGHEIQRFYSPLASRLSIWQIKWVLDDLAFRVLQSEKFDEITALLEERRSQRENMVEALRKDLEWRLEQTSLDFQLEGRAKSIYGIWGKMLEKDISFDQVYDVQAVRIIVANAAACYEALGVVHRSWPVIEDEYDDYIAEPKPNGYRSIHTAVIGPLGRNLEVQIRSREMHLEAELGVCAHWRYKYAEPKKEAPSKAEWLRKALSAQSGDIQSGAYVELKGRHAKGANIYVATPKGHVVELEENATPIDFAYQIHTEVGNRCVGVRIDDRESELNTKLRNGQVVEIVTHSGARPQRIWLQPNLGYTKTHRAKERIQEWFRHHAPDANREAGEDWVKRELDSLGLNLSIDHLSRANDYQSSDDFYIDVALGNVELREMINIALTSSELSVDGAADTAQILNIIAKDRVGLINDVTQCLRNYDLNLSYLKNSTNAETHNTWIELEIEDFPADMLLKIFSELNQISDVEHVGIGKLDLTRR